MGGCDTKGFSCKLQGARTAARVLVKVGAHALRTSPVQEGRPGQSKETRDCPRKQPHDRNVAAVYTLSRELIVPWFAHPAPART